MYGFCSLLAHRIAGWEPDYVTIELDIGQQYLNLASTVHGGLLAALADVAGSLAGLYSDTPDQVRCSLILSLTTNFNGQASSSEIRAGGRKRAGGATSIFPA